MKGTRRRVRTSPTTPLDVHVLDGAAVLPDVDAASLLAVARLLARVGRLVVDFNEDSRRFTLDEQCEWLPAGRHATAAHASEQQEH